MKSSIQNMNLITIISILYLGLYLPKNGLAQDKSYLFKIERSKDSNIIIYSLNTDQCGHLKETCPIEVFWLKREEGNRTEPLTWVQENYSYGIEFLSGNKPNEWEFKFVSYDKRTFKLRKSSDGNYKVYTTSNGREVEVSQIYIQIDGGSFWFPEISKVELYAFEQESHNLVLETIRP